MTLLDILPSLRSVVAPRLDPAHWPAETHYDDRGRVTVGDTVLEDIADHHGTPLATADGIALFRIDVVEPVTDGTTFVWVDGCAEPTSLQAVLVNRHPCGPECTATVLSRSGRAIACDVRLPLDVHAGEVLAVPLR